MIACSTAFPRSSREIGCLPRSSHRDRIPRPGRRDRGAGRAATAVRQAGQGDAAIGPARHAKRRAIGARPLGLRPRRPSIQCADATQGPAGAFRRRGRRVGASVGSQLSGGNNPYFIGGGAGVGLISGIGYASLMPGREATLEPGDTFQVEVGSLSYRPLPTSPPLPLHPVPDATRKNGVHKP